MRSLHAVPAAPLVVDLISFVFLPSLVCTSEVTADVHQCVSVCPSFLFYSPGCIPLHAALPFFSPFGFVR